MGQVSLNKPSSSSVTRNTAKISCSAWDWPYPSDAGTTKTGDSKNGSETTISYSNTVWSWSFSDGGSASTKQPTHTFSGLSAGSANTCRGTLSVKCTKTTTKTSWKTTTEKVQVGEDDNGKPIYEDKETTTITGPTTTTATVSLGSASDSVTVYTKPAAFDWGSGVASGNIIQVSAGLSASKWNTLVARTEQRTNWENQSGGASYSGAKVSSGELIKASKYNILANALGTSNVIGGANGTLISASIFIALQTAVNA